MTTLFRLILALTLGSLLMVGCQQASATPTLPPAKTTPVSPTATPLPATETPATAQPTSSSLISAGNASQLKQIAALELPESMLNTLVFSPDSRTLISGDASGEVNLWEWGTWEKTAFLAPQSGFKRDDDGKANFSANMALSPTGKVFVTTNLNNDVIGLDLNGKELFTFPFGESIFEVDISPGDKYLAVGSFSKKLIVYNLETNQQIADLSSDYERTSNLVFSPDGKILLVSYERPENVIKTWDTATWQEIATFSHATGNLDYHDILFTPDGKSLVIASTRNDIEFFDLESQQVVQKLQGHPRAPYQMAFSPDGSLLASASDDMTLRLWDVKTGKAVLVLRNQHEVGTVAFSPDGKLLAFGVWNEGIQVWALNDVPPSAPAPTASVTATQPLGDNGSGLIAFLSDQDGKPAIYLMNADGSNQRRLVGAKPRGACRAPVWSPDGQRIAYLIIPNGERDLHGPLEVWSVGLDGAAPIELSAGVTDTLLAYPSIDPIWSPDGTRLAVAALHPVAGTSDKRSVVTILRSDGSGVEQAFPLDWIAGGVEWSPNGEQILIQDRSPDESIWAHNAHILSLSNGEIREVSRDLLSAAWSPDGTEIVVVPAQSEQVLIVKLDGTSRPIGPSPAGTTPELAVWSPDGATITVFGTTNNREEAGLYLVTLSTGQVRRVALVAESLDNLEYSPDGKQLLVSATHPGSSSRSTRWLNRSLLVYDLASATLTALTDGKGYDTHASWAPTTTAGAGQGALTAANIMQIEAVATLAGHKDGVTGLVFLPETAHLASLSGDLVLSLWDIKSGQKVKTLTEPGARVYNVSFSQNGELLAVGNPDNTIGVWDVKNGQLIQTLSKSKSFVMKMVFSPDGSLLASGNLEGTITIWDVKSGQALYTLQAPNSPIGSLAFSPNGALLASGNAEGNTDITLWDMESQQALRTLGGHRGNVYNLVFTPDGKQLISSSGDLTIKFWDIESGQGLRTLKGHSGYVYGLTLSPDGNLLASASADGLIKLWDAKSGEELRTLDSHDEYIYFLAFSPDGALLASSVNKGQAIILWGLRP